LYNKLSDYLKNQFGCKIYKIAISGGMTCPNRDGKIGTGGCIFCSQQGSGHFTEKFCGNITKQIENAKQRVSLKIKNGKYIAYFQDYTNTYAPVDYLNQIFFEAITHPDIVALSIATRPDCLSPDILNLLQSLNKIKPVWVELGLQTIHVKTANYIRRGYSLNVYDKAVKSLKSIGINVIVHVILGLPEENKKMMLETVNYVGHSGADGIKLQLLHVLKNTDLATDYEAGKFKCLEIDEYINILEDCIRILPQNIVIHRLTGDGAKSELIAPLWSADKKRVLNCINQAFSRDNVVQGENYNI